MSHVALENAQEKNKTARRIMNGAQELNNFTRTYMLHHEDRPKKQFLMEYHALSRLIDNTRFEDKEQRQFLEKIRQNLETMRNAFIKLVSNYERSGLMENIPLRKEAEGRLAGQILIRSRDSVANALRLKALVDNEIITTQKRISMLIFLLIACVTLSLALLLSRMTRNIAASFATLRKGTQFIASGNLKHRIGLSTQDEIGELARAFDLMAEQLGEITVSRNELIKEIEERTRAEDALRNLKDELEMRVERRTAELTAANRELEAFSYSVSHDLRAPLRSIDGFSKILLDKYLDRLDERGQNYLARVSRAATKMGDLIDDLLKLSRIGRARLNRKRVDISELAQSVAGDLRLSDPDRSVRVEIASGMTARADASLLRIALENLIGNAWKFTAKDPDGRIEIGGTTINDRSVFYVRDNGAGFEMAYVDKLFEPFQRLHTMEEFPGSGIGLTIVKRIITRHGGDVWAESAVGKETTIYFTMGDDD